LQALLLSFFTVMTEKSVWKGRACVVNIKKPHASSRSRLFKAGKTRHRKRWTLIERRCNMGTACAWVCPAADWTVEMSTATRVPHKKSPGPAFPPPPGERNAPRQACAVRGQRQINGADNYRLTMITTAGHGQPNNFGLKIWHIDPLTKAEVVSYDNQGASKGSAVPAAQGAIVLQ
jgi:hypothetical protein